MTGPRLVAIDGADASGKTTQIRAVLHRLHAHGITAHAAPQIAHMPGVLPALAAPEFARWWFEEVLPEDLAARLVGGAKERDAAAVEMGSLTILDRGALTVFATCSAMIALRRDVNWTVAHDQVQEIAECVGYKPREQLRILLMLEGPFEDRWAELLSRQGPPLHAGYRRYQELLHGALAYWREQFVPDYVINSAQDFRSTTRELESMLEPRIPPATTDA